MRDSVRPMPQWNVRCFSLLLLTLGSCLWVFLNNRDLNKGIPVRVREFGDLPLPPCSSRDVPLVLMFDNRPLPSIPNQVSKSFLSGDSFLLMTTALNRMYAIKHGYCFRLARPDGPCRHPNIANATLASQWCKILAVSKALREGFPKILFLDSDSFIHHSEISIDNFLRQMQNQSISPDDEGVDWDPNVRNRTSVGVDVSRSTLIVTADWSTAKKSNTGVLLWQNHNHSLAQALVKAWWSTALAEGAFYALHPSDYEQGGFRVGIYNKPEWQKHIARLPARTMNSREGYWIIHATSAEPEKRVPFATSQIVHDFVEMALSSGKKDLFFSDNMEDAFSIEDEGMLLLQ